MTTDTDKFTSVEDSLSEVKRMVDWLQYVREDEFSASEKSRLIETSKRFVKIAQPIASKYLD